MKLSQLETPALYLDLDAFDRNQAKIVSFLNELEVGFRPHYKSTRCTAIARLQMAAGAKGITCAKTDEAWDLAHAGIEDILIANEVVSSEKIAKVASLAGYCRLTVCVDDAANIADLSTAAVAQGTTIYCLVEYNVGANRCGINTSEECYALAKQVIDSPGLVFDGLQAYAGQLSHEKDYEVRRTSTERIERDLKDLVAYLKDRSVDVREVSGVSTGSVGFRKVDTVFTEVQTGSYAYMDAAYNKLDLIYENALFVLSTVMHVNDDWVIMDTGSKSVSIDQSMPCIAGCDSSEIKVGEEHTKIPASVLTAKVGDKIPLIPGHCCTTMNLHDYIYFVRDGKIVDRVQVTSRGHSK